MYMYIFVNDNMLKLQKEGIFISWDHVYFLFVPSLFGTYLHQYVVDLPLHAVCCRQDVLERDKASPAGDSGREEPEPLDPCLPGELSLVCIPSANYSQLCTTNRIMKELKLLNSLILHSYSVRAYCKFQVWNEQNMTLAQILLIR